MAYRSTKEFGHDIGISCAFRQWRADSHCRYIHGYALAIKLTFEANDLDHRGWVVDFGGLKSLKEWIMETFDHKLMVAGDDPELDFLMKLGTRGVADVVIAPNGTGCERFAELIYHNAKDWLVENGYTPRVTLVSVEVKEHGANSALCFPTYPEPQL